MSLDYFRRGRGLIILAGSATALLIGAIVVNSSPISRLLWTCAAIVGFLFAGMLVSARKKSEGLTKDALRLNTRLEKQIQEISAAIKEQNRRAERESLSSLALDPSGRIGEAERSEVSVFAPTTIPASSIVERPDAHTAGRLAAEQTMDSDSADVLYALMNADAEKWTRLIEFIGSHESAESLQDIAEVGRISAPHLLGKPSREASYLVIEENQFDNGLWEGLLSTQKTTIFLRLLDHVKKARENGTVVIVHPSETANHFSEELRQQATVVLSENSTTWGWDDDIHAPVVNALLHIEAERIVKKEGRAS